MVDHDDRSVVSVESPSCDSRAASYSMSEGPGSLRLLWNHAQRGCVVTIPSGSAGPLASVACAPQSPPSSVVASNAASVGAIFASATAHQAFDDASRSETLIRGTVCSSVGTYGSVGAPGEQSPEATRPHYGPNQMGKSGTKNRRSETAVMRPLQATKIASGRAVGLRCWTFPLSVARLRIVTAVANSMAQIGPQAVSGEVDDLLAGQSSAV